MKIGFAKVDITPRVGVELAGFGPFIHRYSTLVRDRIWARAMAVEQDGKTLVLVSCDLLGVQKEIAQKVRKIVQAETGIPPEAVMVHCTHTHSAPNAGGYGGWGAPDEPYIELLPARIARACLGALDRLEPAEMWHAVVPCEGIGLNREYDQDAPPLEDVLKDDWRPAKPELTDTACQVIKFISRATGRTAGFMTYFGCHPVVCCSQNRQIHGDYCGVATNLLEREMPGSVGLFLQGANGDVNTCVVHKPEQESLLALDIIATRYANAVRSGLQTAKPMPVDSLETKTLEAVFSRKDLSLEKLRSMLAEKEAVLNATDASDADKNVRMTTVNILALRKIINAIEKGRPVAPPIELQMMRIGPVGLFGTPFEVFQAIKNEFCSKSQTKIPLLMSVANDTLGYAPDRTAAARGGYAADTVPMIIGTLPFARIHDELVENLLALERMNLNQLQKSSKTR